MTPEQKLLVQTSFEKVLLIADTAAELFYNRLFELAPDTKPLFSIDMKSQEQKLIATLRIAIKGLDHLNDIIPALQQLGRAHANYGVQDRHYYSGGAALIWTLEQGLGDDFTPSVRAAWIEVYTMLTAVMKDAAAKQAA